MTQEAFDEFKKDITSQFAGVRSDINDLTKALRDLIRLDGDIKRQSDVIGRIGRESEEHEERIRALEIAGAGTKKTVTFMDKIFERGTILVVGAGIMKIISMVGGG